MSLNIPHILLLRNSKKYIKTIFLCVCLIFLKFSHKTLEIYLKFMQNVQEKNITCLGFQDKKNPQQQHWGDSNRPFILKELLMNFLFNI